MSKRTEKKFDKMSTQKKIDWLMRQPDLIKLGFYNRMPEGPEKESIDKGVPGLKYLAEINAGNPGSTSKRVGGTVKVPEKEPWQHGLMKNAGRLSQTGLEDVLNQLRQPYESPINQRMQDIFGHLQNPILQGLMNPEYNNMPRGALFPDQIEQEYQQYHQQNPYQQYEQPSAFSNLLGALGRHAFQQHAVPWLNELEPEDIQQAYGNYVEPGVNRVLSGLGNAYSGAQNLYGRARAFPGNVNQGIEDYIQGGLTMRDPQTWGQSFQQTMSPAFYAARHPLGVLSELGSFAGDAYNRLRGRKNQ